MVEMAVKMVVSVGVVVVEVKEGVEQVDTAELRTKWEVMMELVAKMESVETKVETGTMVASEVEVVETAETEEGD